MAQSDSPGHKPDDEELGGNMPILSHLIELRSRLLWATGVIFAVFVVLSPFSNDIYEMLALPLMRDLPKGSSMIATEVASPFFAPFKLTFVVAVFIAMPYLLYQAWSFVAPGLYRKEKRLAVPLMVSSILLFYIGVAFAYFVVFPVMFAFFTRTAPVGVTVMTDITHYLNFVLKMFFAFGVIFEVPIATLLMVKTGITSVAALNAKRPYIIVGCFVVGMLLTPPDVLSQVLLALPLWGLFESGVLLSRFLVPAQEDAGAQDEDETGEDLDDIERAEEEDTR